MSWQFHQAGTAKALLAKAEEDLNRYKCIEPEESIKQSVIDIIEATLKTAPDNVIFAIDAAGSQTGNDKGILCDLKLEIKTIYGLVTS